MDSPTTQPVRTRDNPTSSHARPIRCRRPAHATLSVSQRLPVSESSWVSFGRGACAVVAVRVKGGPWRTGIREANTPAKMGTAESSTFWDSQGTLWIQQVSRSRHHLFGDNDCSEVCACVCWRDKFPKFTLKIFSNWERRSKMKASILCPNHDSIVCTSINFWNALKSLAENAHGNRASKFPQLLPSKKKKVKPKKKPTDSLLITRSRYQINEKEKKNITTKLESHRLLITLNPLLPPKPRTQ